MKPLVLPASTSLAALAGALTILFCAGLRQIGITLSIEESQALTLVFAVAAAHFTTDSPSPPIAREAVSVAADKADAAAESDAKAAKVASNAEAVKVAKEVAGG